MKKVKQKLVPTRENLMEIINRLGTQELLFLDRLIKNPRTTARDSVEGGAAGRLSQKGLIRGAGADGAIRWEAIPELFDDNNEIQWRISDLGNIKNENDVSGHTRFSENL